jgi:hypothetical protein
VANIIRLRNPNDTTQDDLNKFWTSLSAWIDTQYVIVEFFKGELTKYDNWEGGTYYLQIDYGAPLEMALSLTDASISAKLGAVKLNVGSLQQQAEIELMLF